MGQKTPWATPQLFDVWRQADAAARLAEKEVLTASLDALDGKGGPPSIEDRERAKRLRATADTLLHGALASLRAAALRADHGDPDGPDSHPLP